MTETIDDVHVSSGKPGYVKLCDLKKLLIERCKELREDIKKANNPLFVISAEGRIIELMRIGNLTESDL